MNTPTRHQTPPPEAVIRFAETQDLEALCDLLAQLFLIETDFSIDHDKQYHALSLLLKDSSRAKIFVVELGNNIVAMCNLQIVISTAEGGQSGWLEDVVVDKDFRQRGLATLLLAEVSRWCIKNNILRLQLLADETNAKAEQFYQMQEWSRTHLHAWCKKLS